MKINLGCGATPTEGWLNFDNSPTLHLVRHPIICSIAKLFSLLDQGQQSYLEFAKSHSIYYADAIRKIPVPDDSVDVLYTSHMLEHLDRNEAALFFNQAKRVLKRGGILRIAIPDLRMIIDSYNVDGDADKFVNATLLSIPKPQGLFQRIKATVIGGRHHHWMYDVNSLTKLIRENGFDKISALAAGQTGIADAGGLDLYERHEESIYVEAVRG